MKSTKGLTLIEVLIAIVILAVGVLAAAAMQTTALRASSDAQVIQGITRLAEGEIAYRRQVNLTVSPGNSTVCPIALTFPTGYSCQIAIRPCQLVITATTPPTATMSCPTTGSVSSTDAHQITVTVAGPRDKTITLRTVKANSQ